MNITYRYVLSINARNDTCIILILCLQLFGTCRLTCATITIQSFSKSRSDISLWRSDICTIRIGHSTRQCIFTVAYNTAFLFYRPTIRDAPICITLFDLMKFTSFTVHGRTIPADNVTT
jgi:hypothetical protein